MPGLGGNDTYNVDDSQWICAGMYLFIEGAGTFLVLDVPSITSIHVQYVNFWGNTNSGIAIADDSLVASTGVPPLGAGVYFGVGDPNGSITALFGLFYDALGNVWVKTNNINNNTGWTQIVTA